ncbi:ubiquinol-cytochrome C chaperone family protein [Rhodovibrionaceae bacterium A322]
MFKNSKKGKLGFFERLFPGNANEDSARLLYERIVAQSRLEAFYRDCKVPDTVDGRFELLVLHVFLVLNRLKASHAQTSELGQTLFDIMVYDLDQSLRVSGVGDLKIGPKLRQMTEAFYGRISAYDAGLLDSDETGALKAALERNLYGTTEAPDEVVLTAMVTYMRSVTADLKKQTPENLMAGELSFIGGPAV